MFSKEKLSSPWALFFSMFLTVAMNSAKMDFCVTNCFRCWVHCNPLRHDWSCMTLIELRKDCLVIICNLFSRFFWMLESAEHFVNSFEHHFDVFALMILLNFQYFVNHPVTERFLSFLKYVLFSICFRLKLDVVFCQIGFIFLSDRILV